MFLFFFLRFSRGFSYSILGSIPKDSIPNINIGENDEFCPFQNENKNVDIVFAEDVLKLNVRNGMKKKCTVESSFPKYHIYRNTVKGGFSVSFSQDLPGALSLGTCIINAASTISYKINPNSGYIFTNEKMNFDNFTEISILESPFAFIADKSICPFQISVFSKTMSNKIAKNVCKSQNNYTKIPLIVLLMASFAVMLYYYSRHSVVLDHDAKIWIFDRKLNFIKGGDYDNIDKFTRGYIEDSQKRCIRYNKPVSFVIKVVRNEEAKKFIRVGSFPTNNMIISACWIESFNDEGDARYKVKFESDTHKVIEPPKISFLSYRSYWPYRISFTLDNMAHCTADIPSAAMTPFQPRGKIIFLLISLFYSILRRLRTGKDEELSIPEYCKECISRVRGRRIIVFQNSSVLANVLGEGANDVPIEKFWKLAEKTKPFESQVWEKIISPETKVFVNKTVGSANIITTVIEYPIESSVDVIDDYICPFLSFCILFLFHMGYAIDNAVQFEEFEKVFEKDDQCMFIEYLQNKGTIVGNSVSNLAQIVSFEELVTALDLKGYARAAQMFREVDEIMKTKDEYVNNVLISEDSNVWFTVFVTKEYDSVNDDTLVSVAAERINADKIEEIDAMQTLESICNHPQNLIYKFHINSKGTIVMDDDKLFNFLGVKSFNRTISRIIYDDDKKKFEQSEMLRRIPLRLISNKGPVWFSIARLKDTGFMLCTDKFQEVNYQSFEDFHVAGSTSKVTFWIVNTIKDQVQSLFMQPTIWDIIGVPADTPFAKIISFIHPDDRDEFSRGYSDLISDKKIQYLGEVRILKPGDVYQWHKLSFAKTSDGILHCLAMKINKQREVESKLRETKQLRNLLLSSGKLALWNFSDNNDVMKQPKGFEAGVIMSINMNWNFIESYIPEDYRKKVSREIKKALDTGSAIEFYAPIRMENGTTICVSIRGKGDTLNRQAVGVCIDITELRNAFNRLNVERQKAEEASKQKTLFLTNMSHEIRTPMNGIFGMLDVLSLQELTSEQRLLVDSIRSSSFQLMNLLNDTLHLSKIEQGETEIHRSVFNIWHLIEPTIIANYTRAKENGVNLILDIAAPFPIMVNADPQLFMKILNNLLSNAIKFTKQGHICIKMRIENENLNLEVSDTGIGISKDQQAVIFERFAQADNCVARFFGGSGLGLSLVQEISKFLGGRVNVDSEVGRGSTFTVSIPIETTYYPYRPVPKEKKTVLIRIDDADTKKPVVDWCNYFNYNVIEINSPEEFSSNVNSETIALFIENCGNNMKMYKDIANRVGKVGVCAITDPGDACIFKYCIPRPVMFHHITKFLESVKTGLKSEAPSLKTEISTSKHILVAEDNKTNQKVMKKILEGLHCTFSIAQNGKEAIDLLDKEEFDIVFMDCQMPVLDGLDATRAIRSSGKPYCSIPIVALTAGAVEGSEEACMDAGMDSYLAKPVRIQQITEIIRRFSQH